MRQRAPHKASVVRFGLAAQTAPTVRHQDRTEAISVSHESAAAADPRVTGLRQLLPLGHRSGIGGGPGRGTVRVRI